MFYWLVKYVFVGPLLRLLFRPRVSGIENIPRSGAFIVASNHLSFVDSVFLPLLLPRRLVFLAKSEYFTGRGFRGWATRNFFRAMGMLPIDRSSGKASEASLRTGLTVLRSGIALGIYPEGTRSPDGRLYRGRTGVARMVLQARVPVVPAAVRDTVRVMPVGAKWPKIHRVGVTFGKPLEFNRFEGMEGDRATLRSITDEVMRELQALSQQEYVDVYASDAKRQRAGAPG